MLGNMKEKIAKNLIGKWLKGQKKEEGEINVALMMLEEDENVMLLVVGLKKNDEGNLEVSRVINHVNIDEAI